MKFSCAVFSAPELIVSRSLTGNVSPWAGSGAVWGCAGAGPRARGAAGVLRRHRAPLVRGFGFVVTVVVRRRLVALTASGPPPPEPIPRTPTRFLLGHRSTAELVTL